MKNKNKIRTGRIAEMVRLDVRDSFGNIIYRLKEKTTERIAEIVRLDVTDWFGNIIYRLKGKTTEKIVGVAILDLVRDLFSITDEDIKTLTAELNGDTKEEKSPADRLREQWQKPIKWANPDRF